MSRKIIPVRAYVEYCMRAYNVGGGYVYGSRGQVCTEKLLADCANANPNQKENILVNARKWLGKRVWDCSGIMRGAWSELSSYRSGYVGQIYDEWCTRKGTIDTLPDEPGTFLFRWSDSQKKFTHIGTLVDGGMVVDARNTASGVMYSPLTSYQWTHWGQGDELDFNDQTGMPEELPTLWTGTVKTRTGNGINLWVDATKKLSNSKILDGAELDILGDPDGQGFADARYNGRHGVVDLQYVIPPGGEETAQETYTAMVKGVSIGLNLRRDPSKSANTILLIPDKAQVEVFPQMANEAFAYVRYAGVTGYCTKSYLARLAEDAA